MLNISGYNFRYGSSPTTVIFRNTLSQNETEIISNFFDSGQI